MYEYANFIWENDIMANSQDKQPLIIAFTSRYHKNIKKQEST